MGSCPQVGNTENIFFRSTLDYDIRRGDPVIEYTANWRIWKINEPMVNVIGLNKEMAQYDIGLVFYIGNIIDRMKTGEYTMKYPQPIIVDKPVIVRLSP
ncbi:hypothetical protein ACFSPU_05755 [Haoranjiania flava]|uniref:Uncharacterized protein n=1 Tax=Haoranjiania flava TaxID=1856322 RepID=A0AAE3IMM7_9BACT|nr:hypothetical protein [Haoranjiania flava]MCU7693831.1 hypothetical protein [Haoranjiania flava]